MATFEERLTAIEQDTAQLKRKNEELEGKIELHTIAIGALVNKAQLEKINEQNDKLFKALQDHDQLTNMQLAELREKVEVQVEGKITGLQTEMRQGFETMHTRFESIDTRFDAIDARFDQMLHAIAALTPRADQEAGK